MRAEELSDAQPDLHRIHSRIQVRQACVRDVHVADFDAPVIFLAEDVGAQRGLVHEVHGIGVGRDVLVSEKHAAGEFEVGGEAAVALEVPLQAERVETRAVGGVGGLEGEEDWDGVDCIFEASAEKAGEVGAGEDPSVAQAGVEDAGVAASAGDGVAAAGPGFDFVATLLGAGLGEAQTTMRAAEAGRGVRNSA